MTVVGFPKARDGCINVVTFIHDEVQYRSAPLDTSAWDIVDSALKRRTRT